MLPGDICVSFSNSPVTAERAFDDFATQYPNGTGFGKVIAFFERSSKETGNDYLVAFANPARILKIADGRRVNSISKTQWIGDHAAYVRFREYEVRHQPKPEQGRAINAALFADEEENSPASDLFSIMRNIIADRSLPSVGGFVSVISNRANGFRYSAYSDMLYDWPKGKPADYNLELKDPISFTATEENASFAVAQISPGFMNLNWVAFYFTKARKLFFFFGKPNSLPNQCQVFPDVPATKIADTLNAFCNFDAKWLLLITSPHPAMSGQFDTSTIKEPGNRLSIFIDANTFPKPSTGNVA